MHEVEWTRVVGDVALRTFAVIFIVMRHIIAIGGPTNYLSSYLLSTVVTPQPTYSKISPS